MSDILNKILSDKANEVAHKKQQKPVTRLISEINQTEPTRGFTAALQQTIRLGKPGIIAEIKKASPSEGVIRPDFHPAKIAQAYAANGASCLSVLTDEAYFHGHSDDLKRAKKACQLPVLRKDFIIDAYQLYESRAMGADAILLIAAALTKTQMQELEAIAQENHLDVLVEVHNQAELMSALSLQTPLLGINNRNLHSFETSLSTTIDLLPMIPDQKIVISQSGIQTADDIAYLRAHDVNGFLIGEVLMRQDDPGAALSALIES